MQERVVREIRLLRAMWRALETESRNLLTGHEGGNAGYSQGSSYGFTRQRSTLPGHSGGLSSTAAMASAIGGETGSGGIGKIRGRGE